MTEEHKKKIGLANSISKKGKKLSDEHKLNISKGMIGKKHPYKRPPHSEKTKEKMRLSAIAKYDKIGRKSPIISLLRGTNDYKEWRTLVFERDNYTCQFCGKTKCELNADHIIPFAYLVSQDMYLWDIKNGRTLCVECHRKTPTYGKNIRFVVK